MKSIINKNFAVHSLLLALCVIFLGFVSSCGGDDDDDAITPKEETLAALEGSWSLSSESELANLNVNASDVGVTVDQNGFSLSGDITSFVDGGSFTVDESGDLTNPSVNITSSDMVIDGSPMITMDGASKITVSFKTKEASGRVGGIGGYVLVLVKAS